MFHSALVYLRVQSEESGPANRGLIGRNIRNDICEILFTNYTYRILDIVYSQYYYTCFFLTTYYNNEINIGCFMFENIQVSDQI